MKGLFMSYHMVWELAQLAKDPGVVTELVRIAPPLPNYSKNVKPPVIRGTVDDRVALAFAKGNVMNAVTIAASPATSVRVLAELARFPQIAVLQKLVCNHSLDKETVEFLFASCNTGNHSVSRAWLLYNQHVSKWWDCYSAMCGNDYELVLGATDEFIIGHAKIVSGNELSEYSSELVGTLTPFIGYDKVSDLIKRVASNLLSRHSALVEENAFGVFTRGIADERLRFDVIAQAVCTHGTLRLQG
jgi:hypothetical protein